jgi:hypothetical protein
MEDRFLVRWLRDGLGKRGNGYVAGWAGLRFMGRRIWGWRLLAAMF